MIFLISANPLFREIIRENLAQFKDQCLELEPEKALIALCEMRPEIIIIEARELEKALIVLMNPQKDQIMLLDSHKATLKSIDGIVEAIHAHAQSNNA